MRTKPLEFAHSMTYIDGKMVGFIRRVVDQHTVVNIGKFEVDAVEWENFKMKMEPIAVFYWSWN